MSSAIVSALAGATSQAQTGASPSLETPSDKAIAAKVADLKQWANAAPPADAERTERRDAVQATPTTAPAVVVDFHKEQAMSTDMPEYPVFGPDKFAKTMALRNAEPVEADADGGASPQADLESVSELAKIAADVKANMGDGAGDIEPVEKQWALSAMPEPAEPYDAPAEQPRLIDQNNNAADPSASGGIETAAEAAEVDLTE